MYDNHTLIVENFNDEPVDIKLVGADAIKTLTNLEDNTTITSKMEDMFIGWRKYSANKFSLSLKPHSYKAFKYQ